jgi:hypothetical protein
VANLDVEAFRWNMTEYHRFFGSHGPVAADLLRRGIRVESSAKQHASGRPGPNVVSGRLRDSITWRIGADTISPYVDVGTAVEYAPFLELGTQYMRAYPFLRPALPAARATF